MFLSDYGEDEATYSFKSSKTACLNRKNCWIQFRSPEDSLGLIVGDTSILNLLTTDQYVSNENIFVPLNEKLDLSNISISAKDTNQDINFKKLCIRLGEFQELRWENSFSWFTRTGINLFSAYFLFLISIFLIFSFWLRKSGLGLSLLIYSLVSSIYLISFSEYPRSFFDPVIASGGFHFPLRLLQDLCLILVFYNFYRSNDPYKVIKKVSMIYATVIGVYVLLLLVGIRDYIYYSRIIIVMAPLVAAPMAIGTWFAFKLEDSTDRKVLIPVSIILLFFQLNDLLVFWKLIDSYFMVRVYIPFIVGMALFLYFKRMHDDSITAKKMDERHKIFKEFVHDIKSPLSVLRTFFTDVEISNERKGILNAALDRVESMISHAENPIKEFSLNKISITDSLKEVIDQKNLEYSDMVIAYSFSEQVFVYIDKTKIQRIFSNLINNAYEAYSSNDKKLNIEILLGDEEIRILFSDRGRGVPRAIYKKLFQGNVSTKSPERGIGLLSAYEYIKQRGGNLDIISKENSGTTVEIRLDTVPSNFISELEGNSPSEYELLDFVLIDDDKYIRMSWEYFARNSKKKVATFSNVPEFIENSSKINRKCAIYLDLNINGEKSTRYLEKLHSLGFDKIILATGEDFKDIPVPNYVHSVSGKLPPLHQ